MTKISSEEGQKWLKEWKSKINKKREEQIKKYRISFLDKDLKDRMKELAGAKQMILNILERGQIKSKNATDILEKIESSERYIEQLSIARKKLRQTNTIIGLTLVSIVIIVLIAIINS